MDQAKDNALVRVVNEFEFDGQRLTAIEVEGVVVWSAAQLGRVLGYERDDALPICVQRNWSAEFLPDIDTAYLAGASLRAVKATVPGFVGKNSPKLLVLTESGVNLVLMKTDKPAGVALRRKLATEVLPAIRRTGRYEAPTPPRPTNLAAPVPPKPTPVPNLAGVAPKALPGPVSKGRKCLYCDAPATVILRTGLEVCDNPRHQADAVRGTIGQHELAGDPYRTMMLYRWMQPLPAPTWGDLNAARRVLGRLREQLTDNVSACAQLDVALDLIPDVRYTEVGTRL